MASINYFYSMWKLEDDVFYKSSSLSWGSFKRPCSCVVWNKWFEITTEIFLTSFIFGCTTFFVKNDYKWQVFKILKTYGCSNVAKLSWKKKL